MLLGHEGIGSVVKVGSDVQGIHIGDRVGLPWLGRSCGKCFECVLGHENTCSEMAMRGFTVQGCMAPFATSVGAFAVKIPDSLASAQAAPILCAGVTSYRAIRESGTRAGQWIAIWGASGGLGHLAIQYAKALGLLVLAVETTEEKATYCRSIGADRIVLSTHSNLVEEMKRATDGEGPHGSLVLAPARAAFENAVGSSRRGGHIVLVGLPRDDYMSICISDIIMKRLTISGSLVGTRQDMIEALDFAARGLVRCDVEVKSIRSINESLKLLESFEFKGRIVIDLKE